MNKYFEIAPISEKPEKDGWYEMVYSDGSLCPTKYEYRNGHWRYLFSVLTHWLKPLTSLPVDRETARKIASEAWEAALDEGDAANPTKDEYLKQFE